MNIPIEIVVLFLGAMLALQGWTLREVSNLKTKVAVLEARLCGQAQRRPRAEPEPEPVEIKAI